MPVTIKLKGIEQEFAKKDKELTEFVNTSMRARAFQTLAELKRTTPVDTGRARNSWSITTSGSYFRDSIAGGGSISPEMALPPSDKKLESIYITNGVSYIDKLNAGSSRQAPARFVESAVLQYFDIEGLVYTGAS